MGGRSASSGFRAEMAAAEASRREEEAATAAVTAEEAIRASLAKVAAEWPVEPTPAERRAATEEPEIDEFYRNRLARIEAEIRRQQITASLPLRPGDTAYYRRKVMNARRRIERLQEEYEAIERTARWVARGGIPEAE